MIAKNVGSLELTVAQMVWQLSKAYASLIKSNTPFKNFPSVMLWGPPGVGKSQGIRQIAKNITEQTSKKVEITDVRLLLFNPVDLRGIPTANADKTLAVWLRPKIFQMDDSEDVVNILFLDEISAAPQSVQAAAYQITLDRTVGEHKLPDNCIVVAAGNRVTDRSVAYAMPKALANRLCHIEIAGDHNSWHEWAIGAGINPMVLGVPKSRDSYRDIPVPPTLRWCAQEIRKVDTTFIWEKRKRDTPCNPSNFRDEFKEAIAKIEGVRVLTPHSCRHTYVSQMQALGVDLSTIQSIVGHADVDMTQHYLHVQDGIRQEAIHKFAQAFPLEDIPPEDPETGTCRVIRFPHVG